VLVLSLFIHTSSARDPVSCISYIALESQRFSVCREIFIQPRDLCFDPHLSLRLPRFPPLWVPVMLAAVTTCEVTLLDLTSSRPPISLSSISNPVASSNALCATWSTDGAYLYVAWSHGALFRYEKSGKSCGMVWKTEEASGPPVAITTRDKDTILVAYSSKVVAVDLTKKRLTVELLKVSESLPPSKRARLLNLCIYHLEL